MKLLRKEKILLTLVIVLSIFFRFYGITRMDVQIDHALNSFRALGYTDYLVDTNQTAPINWFGSMPWWSKLSFHDHPPLNFAVQHIFFTLFGDTDTAAFLPFLLAGVASTILLWFILFRETNAVSATIGSLLLAVGSYSVWMSRTGYLEGIEILFITTTIFFLRKVLTDERARNTYGLMVSIGLALLTKYTAVFLIPFVLICLLLFKKKILLQKKFWPSFLLVPALLLPVIIYNIFVFRARGHFDAALSSMLGMRVADYHALWYRNLNLNLLENAKSIVSVFMHNDALPTALILLLLLCWGISHTIQRRASLLTSIATIGIICSLALFLPSGAQARFLTISLPFFTLLLGCAYFELQKQLLHTKIPVLMILVIFGITETFYSINTNLILNPHGTAGIAYAKDHFYSRGYHELDQYLRSTVYGQLPHRKKIQTIADAKVGVDESFDGSIIIDDRMNWFSSMWYFRRYQFYYDRPIVALPFILQRMHDEAWGNNLFTYLQSKGAKKVWLITINEAIDGAQKKSMEYTLYAASLEKVLQEADISPHSIDLYGGQPAVNIYTIPL